MRAAAMGDQSRVVRRVAEGYVGRLAPSPSGHLHVGHAQTFWVASERAKLRNGSLIMRVEDIDVARCKPHFTLDMIEDLRWFGVTWTHGYDTPSPQTPSYVQSKRFPFYEAAWKILYDRGYIYPCRLSRKDVDTALSAPHDKAANPTHDVNSEVIFPPSLRPEFMESVPYESGDNSHLPATWQDMTGPLEQRVNWRFRVPDRGSVQAEVCFEDSCKGSQAFTAGRDFGDFLVWRLDGYPSYELAVIVDDVLMGVTEVVRGEDLLLSTARQLLLIKALFGLDYAAEDAWHTRAAPVRAPTEDAEAEQQTPPAGAERAEEETRQTVEDWFVPDSSRPRRIPRYFHSPLVCDEHGVRLAKRNFSKSLRALRKEGLSPHMIHTQYLRSLAPELLSK